MSEQNLNKMVARERKKLEARRAALIAKQAEFERDLAAIDRELAAVNAYEQALGAAAPKKTAKTRVVGRKKAATRKKAGKRGPRRGSRREVILQTLSGSSAGMTRGDILVAMSAKGDKAAEQAISNALTAMKKAGAINAADGRYTVA